MERRLPIGIQEFEKIRTENYLYIDKTDIIYNLVKHTNYSFFSRPRRFGKTLLLSTLEAYFQGRKELFEGLKIMDLESEWKRYPVLRFQMPSGGYEALQSSINITLLKYEEAYNIQPVTNEYSGRFGYLLQNIKKTTGKPSVILIDEYDAPLQHTLYNEEEHERCRNFYRTFFNNLKSEESSIRFIFITGISKFTQLSLVSALNNLNIITLDPEYEALCGITEEELHTNFDPEIEALGNANGWTAEECYANLKEHYDGYHFSKRMTDMYNPFSLLNALAKKEIMNYWVQSGCSKSLVDYFRNNVDVMPELESVLISSSRLYTTDMTLKDPTIFLYQTGYLTLKDTSTNIYELGIPNEEVRTGIYQNLLPLVVDKQEEEISQTIQRMQMALKRKNIAMAMENLKQMVAATPYSKMNTLSSLEEHFRIIITMAFSVCGYDVRPEMQVSHGIIDLVVKTPQQILLFEIKTTQNGGIAAAKQQIAERGYTAAFVAEPLPVIAIAIEFDTEKRQMVDFEVIS